MDYSVKDKNGDGFKDFITCYHDFDVIYPFDPKTNRFADTAFYMPSASGLIEKPHQIYWGYRDAQYGDRYDYSILYTFKNGTPYFFGRIEYLTKEGHSEKSQVTNVALYKFKNGDYSKPCFIKLLVTSNPGTFDYKKYWQTYYKSIAGHRQQLIYKKNKRKIQLLKND